MSYVDREMERKKKYHALRKAGFKAKEAVKLQWRTWEKVNELCTLHEAFNRQKEEVIAKQSARKRHGDS